MVTAANVADWDTPKRVSVPSVAAPTAVGTVPPCASCRALIAMTLPIARIAMMPAMARPCRLSPTMRPKTRGG